MKNQENTIEILKKLSKEEKMFKVGFVASFLLLFTSFIFLPNGGVLLSLLPLVSAFVCAVFSAKRKKEKKEAAKGLIQSVLVESIKITSYSPTAHIPVSAINNTSLMPYWNEIEGGDLVQGIYKGVNMAFSDIHLKEVHSHRDSDGDSHTTRKTVFKGQWMVFELPKTIDKPLRVREKTGFGLIKHKSDIKTENESFNKKYQILTEDPHTAFYILTPHFMEYIQSADFVAKGTSYLYFGGKYIHVAISNDRDLLELDGKFENIEDVREKIREEMKYLTDIIDELLQNKYLFQGV